MGKSIRRLAKATGDAEFITRVSKADCDALLLAADERERYRRARQELNLGLISERVKNRFARANNDSTKAEPPSDEWADEFTDHAKHATDPDLQELWAKIFERETLSPRSVPRRFLRSIRDLDAKTAGELTALLGCAIEGRAGDLFIMSTSGVFDRTGVDSGVLSRLHDLDLIITPTFNSSVLTGMYVFPNSVFALTRADGSDKTTSLACVRVTTFGNVLANAADVVENGTYIDNLQAHMQREGFTVQRGTQINEQPAGWLRSRAVKGARGGEEKNG